TGDSLIVTMLLKAAAPSCFDAIRALPSTPMIGRSLRPMLRVRSGDATQVLPRSIDLKSRSPPRYTVDGLCGDRLTGVFQEKREFAAAGGGGPMLPPAAPGPTPNCAPSACSPPAPPPPPRPPRPGPRGRMLTLVPRPRSSRLVLPSCDSEYRMRQSEGSF